MFEFFKSEGVATVKSSVYSALGYERLRPVLRREAVANGCKLLDKNRIEYDSRDKPEGCQFPKVEGSLTNRSRHHV